MDWQQYELEREQRLANARDHAASVPLEEIDVGHWDLMRNDTIWPYFERLRREAPIYHHENGIAGPFWSVTSYESVKAIDMDAARFSSEPTIGLNAPTQTNNANDANSFIAMDDPEHAVQRKAVAPVAGPRNLAALEPTIRERILDLEFEIGPNTFFQTNTRAAETLFTEALRMGEFTGDDSVWDLYSGAGAFSLPLARRVKEEQGLDAFVTTQE